MPHSSPSSTASLRAISIDSLLFTLITWSDRRGPGEAGACGLPRGKKQTAVKRLDGKKLLPSPLPACP
jgi:hypothetical protein